MKTSQMLHTQRLTLRPYTRHDVARLVELLADQDVSKTTLNIPYPYTVADAEQYVGFAAGVDENITLIRGLVHNGEIIGGITLRVEPRHSRAESGYWIGKSYWGKGYASEALGCMIKYGFEHLGLNKVIATAFTHNPASSRVMQKCGMTYEGLLRQHVQRDGVFYDLETYGILKKDYQK